MKQKTATILLALLLALFTAHVTVGENNGTQFFSGLGFVLAFCFTVSYYTFQRVKSGLLGGIRATVLVLLMSAAGTFLPLLIMGLSGRYDGENALMLINLGLPALGAGLVNVIAFGIAMLRLYLRDDSA